MAPLLRGVNVLRLVGEYFKVGVCVWLACVGEWVYNAGQAALGGARLDLPLVCGGDEPRAAVSRG